MSEMDFTKTTVGDDFVVEQEIGDGTLTVSTERTNGERGVSFFPVNGRPFRLGRIAADGTLHRADETVIGCAANQTGAELIVAARLIFNASRG